MTLSFWSGSASQARYCRSDRLYFQEQEAPVVFEPRCRMCYRIPCTIGHHSVNTLTNIRYEFFALICISLQSSTINALITSIKSSIMNEVNKLKLLSAFSRDLNLQRRALVIFKYKALDGKSNCIVVEILNDHR